MITPLRAAVTIPALAGHKEIFMKLFLRLFGIGVAALASLLAVPVSASAPSTPSAQHASITKAVSAPTASSGVKIQNQNTGRCIDDSFAFGLRSFPCNGLSFQQWSVVGFQDGTIHLVNENTGRCIDDSLAFGLRSFPCNGLSFQGWFPGFFSDGTIDLQNQNTGRCIDDSLAFGLRSFPCNGLSFQRWF
jgi:hypothetical protein